MILTALNNYYDRLTDQGIEGLPPYGYSNENISYCLQIDREGNLLDVIPLLDTSGKKPRPSVHMVPNPPKRASNIAPCLLWDKSSYVLGLTSSDKEKDQARSKQTHQAFKEYHRYWLGDSNDAGMKALLLFLERWNPEDKML
ncbi:MAG: type I-C CRISPR-associated protein Cas8c/Csd1, partial [Pseudomonadota bacterium]|nr:type I-C CRISPR-associated protein Cas8c/Csd1 [Pseudomonadota bacterium]